MSESRDKFGRRLPLQIIKERAATEPDREWLSIPRGTNPEDGWEKLTFAQLAKAINRVADGIRAFGGVPEPDTFPTIAYIGTNDSRYVSFTFAALKAGYKALFISPRNSTEGQIRLFQDTDCHLIAHTPEFQDAVDSWKKLHKMESMVVSPEKEWYTGEGSTQIDYERSVEKGQWDPFVVLHTSGSSGFPKPIVSKQGWLTTMDSFNKVPPQDGVRMWTTELVSIAKRHIIPMPFFHASGLYFTTFLSIIAGSPCILPIGSKPLTGDLAVQYIEYTGAECILLPPSIVTDMSQVPAQVEALKKLKIVAFGGGNLATRVGNYLVEQGIRMMNMISATELPYPIVFQPDNKLWQYFVFEPKLGGADFRPTAEDPNTYQLFIKRTGLEPNIQGVFYTFPDIDEYDTKDLFRPHPTLPNHWAYAGRADTVIVFSNGEKLNPLTIEHIVSDHAGLKGALVVGQDQFQPAIILEPVIYPKNDEEVKKLIDSVWPLIEEANKSSVAHGHISRDFIMLTKPEKPFPRAGKGTIQRGAAVKLYKDEIEDLYAKAEDSQQANAPKLEVGSESDLLESLQELFTTRLEAPPLGPDTDFFTVGIDSLQVINASRLINAGLKAAGIEVDPSALAPRVIYSHPTFRELAGYLYSLVDSGAAIAGDGVEKVVAQMKGLVEKYTTDLPAANTTKPPPLDEGQTVIVTGSTGGLGSYLLHFMICDSNIKKVICLNRSKDGQGRQIQSCESRGLSTDFSKVEFLQADLSLPDLGIGQAKYDELLSTTDRIIHNGWPVNFNIALSSFEPHIRGVRHFVDFSAKAAKRVPIIFISSIGTVDHWKGDVPEAQITDFTAASMNYGRSKMVSSLILDQATKVSCVPTASVRVGQIAGSRYEKGLWNRQEWFPSIIASSVYLGVLPSNLGVFDEIDWVAIEDVAHLVLEVSGVEERLPVDKINGYFHAVNPKTTTWTKMSAAVREFYGPRIKATVSFREWIDLLKASQETTTDVSKNPGIKLIDSYEGFFSGTSEDQVKFSMERTKSYSKTAANMEAVTPELLQNWCKQWNY
ncbi:acetyl-CoA synthetase-like protein [Annulohypoxylon truncatum]|uniref:acetyl-CoA synthetase-like protein n=1 Tax=Annulohypoxylon truncatum TaxID=327061 RepID=UPI0020081703|nr:acetyl-CoA synthetase-like protein [Annulohypoxylon truncatum]KAI1213858.1 acetyl-CoA synthetase-like protein [Annulohypoxylon truncatum]